MATGLKDPRSYYDEFSRWYERERHVGYHAYLDRAEVAVVRPYVEGKRALEVGSGTGLILKELDEHARTAVGIDLSFEMLRGGGNRNLTVAQATANHLPFADESFDTVCSFKVLSHVPDLGGAFREMERVTKPGGHLVVELYNRASLRYVIRRLKPAGHVSEATHENQVFTRFYTLAELKELLPPSLELVDVKGIRTLTAVPQLFKIPVAGRLIELLEGAATRSPLTYFGGFLILVLQKRS